MSEQELFPPGTLIKDEYRIEECVGQGGLGVVYRGVVIATGEQVAIKRLKKSTYHGISTAHFRREARTQARLQHQYIVGHRATLEDQGNHFIIMEFVDGQNLDALIHHSHTYPRLPIARIHGIFKQLLNGLGYAHTQDIVHRDIKPSNVMLTSTGEVKLADFGLAFTHDEQRLTKTGVLHGTPAYMAPEQLQGMRDIDHRSDIYSAGLTLYEALAGGTPYLRVGEHLPAFELMGRKLLSEPYPLEEYGVTVSKELGLVISKSIARKREERYQSCEEFWEALSFALQHDSRWGLEASPTPLVPSWGASGQHAVEDKRSLKRIKYVSSFAKEFTKNELIQLIEKAQRYNQEKEITGFLAVSGNLFFQILEGPTEEVNQLFARILRDDRHANVMILRETNDSRGRLFPDWSMKLMDLSQSSVESLAPLREILHTIFMQRESIDRLTLTLERSVWQEVSRQSSPKSPITKEL